MSLNADDDNAPEPEPDYNEEEPPPDPSSGKHLQYTDDQTEVQQNWFNFV